MTVIYSVGPCPTCEQCAPRSCALFADTRLLRLDEQPSMLSGHGGEGSAFGLEVAPWRVTDGEHASNTTGHGCA